MTSILQEAISFTLGREGGYYDGSEARDPNPTNFGVTQKTYDAARRRWGRPARPVKEITMTEVESIYAGYWQPAGCHLLDRAPAITLFDHSINAGPKAAVKILQQALGVTPDGIIGPNTEAAIYTSRRDPDGLARRICWERVGFYLDLARSPRMRPNLLSWIQRVVRFREQYLS